MNRLTKKGCQGYFVDDIDKSTDKLAQLEDDEERIGLSLHTLSHCTWVYVRKGKKIVKVSVLINLRCRWVLIQAFWVFVKRIPFRKYGKTWALTKEELTNE